jgi:hypothetical protein
MAIQYLSSINLTTNQLQYAVIQPATSDPTLYTPVAGQIYYNSVSNKLRLYGSGGWVDVGQDGDITEIQTTTSSQLTITNGTGPIPSLAINTAAVTNGSASLATGDQIYDFVVGQGYLTTAVTSVATGSGLTGGTITTTGTISLDYAGVDNFIVIGTTATASADDAILFNDDADGNVKKTSFGTIPMDALTLVKNYVDASTTAALVFQGGYDAATNTPNLDVVPTITGIKTGWTFAVTVDGTFFTEQVRVGDLLIANVNNPTTLADWTTLQNNIDLATYTVPGIASFSSSDFVVTAGAVSLATPAATSYATTISVTSTVTHSLNTKDVNVQLYDTVTFETIFSDVSRPTVNTVTVTFATAPTNPIRVLVTKVG